MSHQMRAGIETGSLVNHVMSGAREQEPVVGMAATVLKWTDRSAGTVVNVERNRAGVVVGFTVQRDRAVRTDTRGMSEAQDYAYAPNLTGERWIFCRVSRGAAKGAWRVNGLKSGWAVLLGSRQEYHDFSF